jgi:hypothetical protein
MQVGGAPDSSPMTNTPGVDTPPEDGPAPDEEQGLARPSSSRHLSRSLLGSNGLNEQETELLTRDTSVVETAAGSIRRKTSQLLEVMSSSSARADRPMSMRLATLIQAYADSDVANSIRVEMAAVSRVEGETDALDISIASLSSKTRRRASYGTQFTILSGRAFKNLYRNPALLAAHYISSVVIACEWRDIVIVDVFSQSNSLIE